jgi:hypothetical protein
MVTPMHDHLQTRFSLPLPTVQQDLTSDLCLGVSDPFFLDLDVVSDVGTAALTQQGLLNVCCSAPTCSFFDLVFFLAGSFVRALDSNVVSGSMVLALRRVAWELCCAACNRFLVSSGDFRVVTVQDERPMLALARSPTPVQATVDRPEAVRAPPVTQVAQAPLFSVHA